MRYLNRLPAEGINVTRVNPLVHLAKLVIAAALVVALLLFVLNVSSAALARRVPFSVELSLMQEIDVPLGDTAHPMARYLNDLAVRLSAYMPLPEGMLFRLHYSDESTFNAFATIGGNIVFYRGLLAMMPDENTLAMIVAHEMSHVQHRDPIAGLGGGLSSMVALMLLSGSVGGGVAAEVLSGAGTLTQMSFSRKMELAADRQALETIAGYYGHAGGAEALFRLFGQQRENDRVPEWLTEFASTHPLDQSRSDAVRQQAVENRWPRTGSLTPLPEEFHTWLNQPALQ